ncbi:glycosyltransferase family 2 protein [Flavobacterium limnosediminis]|nr:glycosyltransferase family A protein [Flavobacterium limnosediminis]
MQSPLLSVIMPVFNGEKFLSETIESILNQTFTDFELLILNDNSTDSTQAIIERYQEKDSRIRTIIKESNVGPANLRNEGFSLAKGEYIALMDADDIALPTRFEKQVQVLNTNPEVGVCGTWFTFFGGKKNKTVKQPENHDKIKISFLSSCSIGNPTVMVRKSALKEHRFENQYVPVEDYDLWSRMIFTTNFHIVQESLLRYRQHDSNISKTKIENVNRSVRAVKSNMLKQFGIDSSDTNVDVYLNALTMKRKLTPEEIKNTIKASKFIISQNEKLGNFDKVLLKKQIDSVLLRTVRNAKKHNMSFFNYLKNEEKDLFRQIKFLDKTILFFKCITG